MLNSTEDIIDNASNVLIEEAMGLNDAAQRLKNNKESREGYHQAIYLMFKSLDAGGKIVVTGVGKSGKIGEKIVATMLSTGTCATFLHPVEALHGDLGTVQPNDVVLALSFSGNTEELLMLLPSLKHRRIPVIGLGGNSKSKLARECAAWIDGYVKREAGGSIPAPTSSTTLTLALGDALALTLAKLRTFTTDGFALNHPGGSLGRRLLLKVKDIVIDSQKVASVNRNTSLDVVIMEMTKHPKGCGVIVMDDDCTDTNTFGDMGNTLYPSPPLSETSSVDEYECNKPTKIAGVITHGDIHRILKSSTREGIFQIRAVDIMSPNPIVFDQDGLASEAVTLMKNKNIPLLPVISHDKNWTGVITLKDLQELF
jgi:arabinose-5-phosphate isomerase